MRRFALALVSLLVVAVAVPAVAPAARPKKQPEHRHGGSVDRAWPRDQSDQAPDNPLAQWLAKQVGPVPVNASGKKKTRTPARSVVARAAAHGSGTTTSASSVSFGSTNTAGSLLLVRSFEIPTTDASYSRLANLSWTYDNALAAIAFTDLGYKEQAQQLLDQLKALQLNDGSLAFAYDVKTGASSGQIRSNALAWVGLAGVAYERRYGNGRYDGLTAGVAKYLLASRRTDGLVLGGPDVQWVSTQHNLLAAEFFREAGVEYGRNVIGSSITGTAMTTAYTTAGNAITSKLILQAGTQAFFVEGIDDARIPLDVQTLGSVFLKLRGDARATQVASWMQSNLYQSPRTVGSILWSGFKPFAGSTAPNVIWSEGTIQADWALNRLGAGSSPADDAVLSILSTTNGGLIGPMGADHAVDDRAWGEFPSWPTSAAGSWLLILYGGGDGLFT